MQAPTDADLLNNFKKSVTVDNSGKLAFWGKGPNPCKWPGVACNAAGRVEIM